jgi:hypothetical protein
MIKVTTADQSEYLINFEKDRVSISNVIEGKWFSPIADILNGKIKNHYDYPFKNEEEINEIIIKIWNNRSMI